MNPVCCPVSAIPVVNLSEASLAPLAPKQTITIDWSTCLVSSGATRLPIVVGSTQPRNQCFSFQQFPDTQQISELILGRQ